MVRSGLGGDRQAVGLRCPDQFDTLGRRQVQEVHPDAGESHQLDVAVEHQFLGDRRPAGQAEPAAARSFVHHGALGEPFDLAVLGQGDPEPIGVLEGPTHQERVLHAVAVVGEDPHAGVSEFGERRQLRAGTADGDRPGGQDLAESCSLALAAHEVDDLDTVLRRVGVGHRDDRGEPPERGGPAAGLDRLGLLAPGLAQVHVQVDEPGRHDQSGRIDHVVAVAGRQLGGDLDDRSCRRCGRRRDAPRSGR